MIQTSVNAFLITTGLLVATTTIIFIVFALGTLTDKYQKRTNFYWKAVIGATLEYLSVAGVIWGIATAVCLLFFTIGFASQLGGVIL